MLSLLSIIHWLIIESNKILTKLLEQSLKRDGSHYFSSNDKHVFVTFKQQAIELLWCQKGLLDNNLC